MSQDALSQSLPAPPQRIVSLVPSITESLFDLGIGERVVGATDYCIYPAEPLEAVPRVGGPKTPVIEQIMALEPDLVMANREENRLEDVRALQEAGVPVWVTYPRTVKQALEMLWDIIVLLQGLDRTAGLLTIEMAYDWACRANEGCDPVRVFCPIWRDPWMTISADTYTHDLLRICGGRNIFDDSREARYPVVSLQEVAARTPQVILLPSEPFPFDETHLADFAPYPELLDRVLLVDGTLLTWFGTRLGQALQQVPSWLRSQGG
jgi:ABC-type Fe3+-hydroxamate transport system substrate-binding protein